MAFDVYGIGNALVDIQVQVGDSTLEQLDFSKGIMTLVDSATQERVLQQLEGLDQTRCAGGSAANTILGIAEFGGQAAYCAKVGQDEIGEFCLHDMRQLGVAIEVPQANGATGTSVILITPDAERTMLTHLGVSADLTADDVDEQHVADSKYVYIEGYLFSSPTTREAAYRAIEIAKKHGVRVAFTVSDPFLIAGCRDEFWDLIKGPVDLLFCNLEEAQSLTGETDAIACAHAIHSHAENVAMTMGPNGSIIMHAGEAIPIEGVPISARDTTGAGDMYAAGLLYGITAGHSWRASGHFASHAAARIVSQFGARLQQSFTSDEIANLLK